MTNEEATIDIPAAQSRIQEILGSKVLTKVVEEHLPELKQRRPRSDKGIPKGPKKPIENKGVLLPEQVIHIETLFRGVIAAEASLREGRKRIYGLS